MPIDPTLVKEDPDEYWGEPFANALVDVGNNGAVLAPITLRELTMLRFINTVTDKPDWVTKVLDETIIAKWKEESIGLSNPSIHSEMTEQMFNYCISELHHRAKEFPSSPRGAIRVFNGDVCKSDTAVSNETKLALQKAVKVLEDVPESQKDWHPGSDGKVLDLVHPSLFPLVYGVSKILPVGAPVTTLEDCIKRCGEGNIIPVQDESSRLSDEDAWSDKFQWLPCEVDISGEKPRVISYINNLHPKRHRELYLLVEDIIDAAIPLWEKTLVFREDLASTPARITYTSCTYNPDPESWAEEDQIQPEEDEDEDDFHDRKYEWIKAIRRLVKPEPVEQFDLSILERRPFSLRQDFGSLPLQVIVKLANIELTPEKPKYEGVVDGCLYIDQNESICATAIYY
ncbi:hypothetical protein MD484_g8801, partial [Candolleomyces efflorescens]